MSQPKLVPTYTAWWTEARAYKQFAQGCYAVAHRTRDSQLVIKKLASAYVKCLKMFFNFHKFASVTGMLLELGLLSFRTLRHNVRRVSMYHNTLLQTVDKFCGAFAL